MASPPHADPASKPDSAAPRPALYESRFVEVGGLKLHYLDYGTPGLPPMLCVHGGAAHAHWYDYVADSFSSEYHVRALDLRGHGDSEWADPPDYSYDDYAAELAGVVEKLDLRDFVLIGHSMGGMVSLVYSATYPGRVKTLIVVDTTMHMSEDRIAAMRDIGERPGGRYASREDLVARYRLRPTGTLARPEVVRYIASHSAREDEDGRWRHKFDRNVYGLRKRLDGIPYWGKISIPALLVKGDRSERITDEVIAGVKERCPHVEVAAVPNSDHHVTLDNPDGFQRTINAFLSRHG